VTGATSRPIGGRGARQRGVALLLVVGAVAGMLAASALAVSGDAAAALGLPDAGALVARSIPVVRVLAEIAATATVGALLLAAVLAPPQRSGYLDIAGYRAVRVAAVSATTWAAAALLMVPLTVAEALGRPLPDVLAVAPLTAALTLLPTSAAWLIAAVIAAAVAVGSAATLTWGWACALFVASVGGLLPVAASGHSAVGGSHDIATDSLLLHVVAAALWVGGLLAILLVATSTPRALRTALPRFSALAGWCWSVLALSGLVNLAVRVELTVESLLTPYGAVVGAKTVALAVLGLIGLVHRRRTLPAAVHGRPADLLRWGGVELLIMTLTIGLAVGLGRTPPPPGPVTEPSRVAEALGYDLAQPAGPLQLLTSARVDVVFALLVAVLLAGYLLGVHRLRSGGAAWPASRTLAWSAGALAVLVATSSGIGRYGAAMFSVGVVGQLMLLVVAPALLAAGAPLRLARHALPVAGATLGPSPRGSLLWLLRRPLVRTIRRPGSGLAVLAAVQVALYGAGWLDLLLESQVGRLLLDLVLLATGCIVAAAFTGDRRPGRRDLLGLVGVPTIVGLSLVVRPDVVGDGHFRGLGLAWVPDLIAEQRWAGAVWLMGLVVVATSIIVIRSAGDHRPRRDVPLPKPADLVR
jgi:cytochrome c oxidase assembly factor CtaG/putative copper export protein